MWRFAILKTSFQEIRTELNDPQLSSADCFLYAIRQKLSSKAQKLFLRAQTRYQRYSKLLSYVKQNAAIDAAAPERQIEGAHLKAIIDFEMAEKQNDDDWTFSVGGIAQVLDDFFILNEYLEIQKSDRLPSWCTRYGVFALLPEEYKEINAIEDEVAKKQAVLEKVRPLLEPVLSFFVAFCHALQEDENELTAVDAYWLGLVDEVFGNKELSALRLVGEHKDD